MKTRSQSKIELWIESGSPRRCLKSYYLKYCKIYCSRCKMMEQTFATILFINLLIKISNHWKKGCHWRKFEVINKLEFSAQANVRALFLIRFLKLHRISLVVFFFWGVIFRAFSQIHEILLPSWWEVLVTERLALRLDQKFIYEKSPPKFVDLDFIL